MKETTVKSVEDEYGHSRRTVAVVGGIMALEPQYRRVLEESNFFPKIYNQDSARLVGKIKRTHAIILFTGTVSHKMAEKIKRMAALREIPLFTVQPSSISALRRSMGNLPDTSA
jgi:hypothetical protein